jgi:hypothetical protein
MRMTLPPRALMALAGLAALVVAMAHPGMAQPVPAFAPGQIWSIRSDAPTPVRVIIGRIERFGDATAIHVSIIDVPIPPGAPNAGGITRIAHMPFDEAALAASVDELVGTGAAPLPNFADGYRQWRDNRGGIFTIAVDEAIALAFAGIT